MLILYSKLLAHLIRLYFITYMVISAALIIRTVHNCACVEHGSAHTVIDIWSHVSVLMVVANLDTPAQLCGVVCHLWCAVFAHVCSTT